MYKVDSTKTKGTLIFICGKMGAGKSTKSKKLARDRNGVLLSEDEWLTSLYPGLIASFDDYLKYSALLNPLLKEHVKRILEAGTNVVMDFPANTISQREWFKEIASESKTQHELLYLDVSDEVCLRQILERRTKQPERASFDTESMFYEVTKYFEAPSKNEGLNILIEKRNA